MNSEVFDNPDLVDAIFAFIETEFPDMASRTAVLKEEVRREFSGIEIYIPRRSVAERERITAEVLRVFDGRNAVEVARRLGIGRATVYRIIKQAGSKK
ncbi:Mor transcription activator family protein [Massilia sp. BKSP1R2A-1]|uniref:Mor transcription activator family protein n=1 Tax=Massilia sp. BKSP1R2A-1 TaxID=3422595 RepID=UPI003D3490F9